jgi:hypothetical protein
MRFIKKFKLFKEEFVGGTETAPTTRPAQPETKPVTKPGQRPNRPSPIRRDKPAVSPDPKAKKEKTPSKATINDVIKKFAKLTNQEI